MPQVTRRRALLAAAGVVSTLSALGVANSTALADPEPRTGARGADAGAGADGFDEVFQGRRIQGVRTAPDASAARKGGHSGHSGHGAAGGQDHSGHATEGWSVRIDGRDLHLMRNADGTWVSVVNHYETFDSPLAAARAAVVDLKGAQLLPLQTGGAR
ncbi:tyrosinase cofactor [Streptomyces bambusae]|uniref:apotyrosinase chaperone MelC1 n=1 Tax=Streptomyces bambusae TaxID=1550616 RepID=UPI001CFCA441|nr:tyrosinase cofactor [Streptomyces bambusae]MCB5166514.1 tyrosinase cofactor [Streptomyces bambusae]